MANRDVAELLLGLLKTSETAQAVAIRALLINSAESIIETGDLVEDNLDLAEAQRREDDNPAKALYLSVQDAGEDRIGFTSVLNQFVVVRIYDRKRGYSNIRALRDAVRAWLRGFETGYLGNLDDGGVLQVRYVSRSGHRYDVAMVVEWEGLTYQATVEYAVDDD